MKKQTLFFLILCFGLSLRAQVEAKPDIDRIYYINQAGEKIEGTISVEEEFVYLIIESRNSIGKDVLLTLDEDEEFFYGKDLLLGGSSVTFPITADVQQVKLVLYNPKIKKHYKKRKKLEGFKNAKDAK